METNPSLDDHVGTSDDGVAPWELRLNETDEAILTEIAENGRATLGILDEEIDTSKPYLSGRARRLTEHGLLRKRVTVYELTPVGAYLYESSVKRPDIPKRQREQ